MNDLDDIEEAMDDAGYEWGVWYWATYDGRVGKVERGPFRWEWLFIPNEPTHDLDHAHVMGSDPDLRVGGKLRT